MPYIRKMERVMFAPALREVRHALSHVYHPGHLNYLLTAILDEYLAPHPLQYTRLNEVIGVLECVKQEFYRRIIGPYESAKMEVTGDVFDERLIVSPIQHDQINHTTGGAE